MARALGHKGRFAIAYLLLGAAAGAAIGAAIVLIQRPAPEPPPPWSTWKPAVGSLGSTAQAIASHVGGSYRLSDGRQLARVVLSAPSEAAANVEAIALADRPGAVTVFNPDTTMLYTLCGTEQNCRLGGASTAGVDALRREALELALYTFKYAKVADVAVFFPPGEGDNRSKNVFFFPRADLAGQLKRPLRVTLPHGAAPTRGRVDPRELPTLDNLTGGHHFRFDVETINNRHVLVLQPVA